MTSRLGGYIVSGPIINNINLNNIIESTLNRVCATHTVRSYLLNLLHRRQIRHPTIVLVLDNCWPYSMAGTCNPGRIVLTTEREHAFTTCSRSRFAWIKVPLDLPTMTSEIRYNVHSQRILAGKYYNLHPVPQPTLPPGA